MDGKTVLILESFPTIPTSMGLIPSVSSFMSPAFTVMMKGFPTLLTLVRLLFGVDSSMFGELCFVAEGFSTPRAPTVFLLSVESSVFACTGGQGLVLQYQLSGGFRGRGEKGE